MRDHEAASHSGLEVGRPVVEPITAAYVHIPFCVRKCGYCDFVSYAGCLERLPEYIDAVTREIHAVPPSLSESPLASIYLGGGTPSLLSPVQAERLLRTLEDRFSLARHAEITLEVNPGTVDAAKLRDYVGVGFNRISIGVQSTRPHLLHLLGRIHRPEEAIGTILNARAAGFQRISADLMFGLPQQSIDDVADTVSTILALPVSHLSFYGLSIETGTPFHERYGLHPEKLPEDEMERAHYETILEQAGKAGLSHYEISNAAQPGHECRHNLVYWQARPYHGFGAGAHGYTDGVRRANSQALDDYIARLTAADGPHAAAVEEHHMTLDEQEQEFMMLGLRLIAGVDAGSFRHRFGRPLEIRFQRELDSCLARGLIEKTLSGYRLTRRGIDLANQVFMEFV